MLIKLDMTSDIPIYLQLRNEIVIGIGSGRLTAGDGLPTVRQLAGDLGINTMTVNKAYQLLKDEGFIEIDRRHGAKISIPSRGTQEQEGKWLDQLTLLLAEGLARGLSKQEVSEICQGLQEKILGEADDNE